MKSTDMYLRSTAQQRRHASAMPRGQQRPTKQEAPRGTFKHTNERHRGSCQAGERAMETHRAPATLITPLKVLVVVPWSWNSVPANSM